MTLVDRYKSSQYEIIELLPAVLCRVAGSTGGKNYYYFQPSSRTFTGLFVEKGKIAAASGAIIQLLELRTSLGDLFCPKSTPTQAPDIPLSGYKILDASGILGATATVPATITPTATTVQSRVLIRDKISGRQWLYSQQTKSVKTGLNGKAAGYIYTLLPQIRATANIVDVMDSSDGQTVCLFSGANLLAY